MKKKRPLATCIALATGIGLFAAEPGTAGSVSVTTANPRTGSHHARVAVGRSCSADDLQVPEGAVPGDQVFQACTTISAADVDVVSGRVVFRAGESVTLGSGFSVASGASLVVETGPLARGEGILEDRSPDGVGAYEARFSLDAAALDLQAGESFEHFLALDESGSPELVLGIRRSAGSNRIFLETSTDDGARLSTEGLEELVLLPGWHSVAVSWRASTGADTGRAEACLDAEPGSASRCILLSGVDNDTGRIDAIRWGAQETPRAEMGNLDIDDFASWGGSP